MLERRGFEVVELAGQGSVYRRIEALEREA
jgi:hypothetical protein